jgi:hypothetical protein
MVRTRLITLSLGLNLNSYTCEFLQLLMSNIQRGARKVWWSLSCETHLPRRSFFSIEHIASLIIRYRKSRGRNVKQSVARYLNLCLLPRGYGFKPHILCFNVHFNNSLCQTYRGECEGFCGSGVRLLPHKYRVVGLNLVSGSWLPIGTLSQECHTKMVGAISGGG